ncbi:MAG: GNAT family N-acetyltransferase [Burkholderiales bacterium RIFCSPLOWO2_02_FULL_57_36]|nr:MAG: GNAT family N-acetyltransferase [Burkholderiales bacterium RIFCSPLOWO2_02_FULL_57_36]
MKFRITIGDWDAQQLHARTVRDDVFINEQNIPVELEWDEMDRVSLHAVVIGEAGQPIGTGRLLPDGHIGRMAVTRVLRGAGIGGAILEALMQQARKRGDKAVLLNAQIRAEPFYARYGFTREGEEFMEAGIPHIRMRHVFR